MTTDVDPRIDRVAAALHKADSSGFYRAQAWIRLNWDELVNINSWSARTAVSRYREMAKAAIDAILGPTESDPER